MRYCQPHCEEDMLCVTASIMLKKICDEEDMLYFTASLIVEKILMCSFINVPPVPSPEPGGFV